MLQGRQRTLRLKLLVSMALVWLLTGFAGTATDARQTHYAIAASETPHCQQEQDDAQGLSADNDLHHLYARITESLSLTSESGQMRTGTSQTRAQQRTDGGRTTTSALQATRLSTSGCHLYSHFALASSGVAFISSRACDYYVFALRRILD